MEKDNNEFQNNAGTIIKKNKFLKIFFLILSLVFFMPSVMSLANFSISSSSSTPLNLLALNFHISIILYPGIYIASTVLSKILFYYRRYKLAILINNLPLINIFTFIIVAFAYLLFLL